MRAENASVTIMFAFPYALILTDATRGYTTASLRSPVPTLRHSHFKELRSHLSRRDKSNSKIFDIQFMKQQHKRVPHFSAEPHRQNKAPYIVRQQ